MTSPATAEENAALRAEVADLRARLAVGLRSARAVLEAWCCPECLGGLCTACVGAGRDEAEQACEACAGKGAIRHLDGCELERFVVWKEGGAR